MNAIELLFPIDKLHPPSAADVKYCRARILKNKYFDFDQQIKIDVDARKTTYVKINSKVCELKKVNTCSFF